MFSHIFHLYASSNFHPRKLRRIVRIMLCFFPLVVCVAFSLAACRNCEERPLNQQKLDEVRRLVENNCKTGMSLDDLKVFLRDQGIKFDTDFSYSEREYGDTMPACIRKTKPWFSLTYSEGYFLLFVVDKENKLRSFSIKETFTGP